MECIISEDTINPLIEDAEINSIAFSIFSSDEIRKLSIVEVTESKRTGEGTVYDPRMGVVQNYANCVVCKKPNQSGIDGFGGCPGHCGHIELPPVPHPMYLTQILTYLNCFCSDKDCASLLITAEEIKIKGWFKHKGLSRLNKIKEYTSNKGWCPKCEARKYNFFLNDYKFHKEVKKSKKGKTSDKAPQVSPKEIQEILENITPEDVKLLGFSDEIVPADLIMTALLVLPICARPFIETSKGSCDDDLTDKYIEIIKCCNKLKKNLNENDKNEAADKLNFHIRTLMYNHNNQAKQNNGRPIKCIRKRMNGKGGIFRLHISGKRGEFNGRTVIGPDPTLMADEISIPIEFAEKLTFPENVTSRNILYMEDLVNKGKATIVIRDGKKFNLNSFLKTKATYEVGDELLPGDMIIRDDKKIDPVKYKEKIGKELLLQSTDKILRNGKIKKNIKPIQKIPFDLEMNDVVMRNDNFINVEGHISIYGDFELQKGDRVFRNRKELKNLIPPQSRIFKLKLGDIVERHLKDGDYVLFNRQPTYFLCRVGTGGTIKSLQPPSHFNRNGETPQ